MIKLISNQVAAVSTVWQEFKNKFAHLRGGWLGMLGLLLIINTMVFAAILRSNTPFMDDIPRVFTNYADWYNEDDARHGIQALVFFFFGDHTIGDIAPLNQFIAILVMSVASLCLCTLFQKKVTYAGLSAASLLSIFPYYAFNLIFRFDSLFMSLTALIAILPLLFSKTRFFPFLGVISSLAIMSIYQLNISVLLVTTFFYFTYQFFHQELPVKTLLNRFLLYGLGVLVGIGVWFLLVNFQTITLGDDGHHNISLSYLPANLPYHLKNIFWQWQPNLIGPLLIISGATFVISTIYSGLKAFFSSKFPAKKYQYLASIGLLLFTAVIGIGLSIFVQLVTKAHFTPYYLMGFNTYLAVVLLIVSEQVSAYPKFFRVTWQAFLVYLILQAGIVSTMIGNIQAANFDFYMQEAKSAADAIKERPWFDPYRKYSVVNSWYFGRQTNNAPYTTIGLIMKYPIVDFITYSDTSAFLLYYLRNFDPVHDMPDDAVYVETIRSTATYDLEVYDRGWWRMVYFNHHATASGILHPDYYLHPDELL